MRRIYEVEVTHRIFVTAVNEDAAARWVENNITEWSSDPAESVVASPIVLRDTFDPTTGQIHPAKLNLSDEVRQSIPWASDGLEEDECSLTVLQWVEREAKARAAK